MTVSLVGSGVPESLQSIIQENTLERIFHDALFPRQLYRMDALPSVWQANLGEAILFTRTGLIQADTAALEPGKDPLPSGYDTEQWRAEARQHGNTIDTHMPSSHVALSSIFLRNTQQLGMNAGQTMDRIARNNLYTSYLGGEASATAAAVATDTQISVSTLNGFTEVLSGGRLADVSGSNPLAVSFTGTEPDNTIVGFSAADPAEPNGPGTLTLGSPLSVGVAIREGVLAATRSRRLRVGGAATIDGLTSSNILTLNDIITAVSRLRQNNVPTHPDGYYHIHIEPETEAQLFRDNHWQRQYQSLPDSFQYRELAIGQVVGTVVYRNTEVPTALTVKSTIALPGGGGDALLAPEIGAEIANEAGLPVRRTIVTGGGCMYEKYLDESKYITEAGVLGKIGNFSITNNGLAIMTDRVRFLLRSPQDRLQQVVSQTWSWSGDFPVPTDTLTGDEARFKRAIVIEHG